MGLPGSGKTTLANELAPLLNAKRLNADEVRKEVNDWDFSLEGRLRQSKRMKDMSEKYIKENRHVIADFICPTEKTRNDYNPDFLIFMDTIREGRFDDTNKMFQPPEKYDFKIKYMDATMWAFLIKQDILDKHGNLGPHSK